MLWWEKNKTFAHLFYVEALRSSVAEQHCSVGSIADLRAGDRWFHPRLGQYSFRGLIIDIATGFIVSTMGMWESSQWLEKNVVWGTG